MMDKVVHTIIAPIERTKLLLQTQESNMAILVGGHMKFKGMVDCIVRTMKEEGVLSLWRGNGSIVLRYFFLFFLFSIFLFFLFYYFIISYFF
ncbi:Probable ADP,ATP carrier protein At5g56450 [Linum perenne]